MKHMIESKCEVPGFEDEFQASVSVPVERYEKLILAERCMDTAATQIAEEWAIAADNGYGAPTDYMKAILAVYNPGLYCSTAKAVEDIKENNRRYKEMHEAVVKMGKAAANVADSAAKTAEAFHKAANVMPPVQTDLF
jgi:allantoicase